MSISVEFEEELTKLINRHSIENVGNIPDYMLAADVCDYIERLGELMKARDKWFNFGPFQKKDIKENTA